eukprot:IDg10279t1
MESRMSGVGGDVGEAEELLSVMREARADFEQRKDAKRKKACCAAARDWKGAVVLEDGDADARPSVEEDSGAGSAAGSAAGSVPGSSRKKRKVAEVYAIENETEAFTAALERGDAKKNAIDAQRLALERERFEAEKLERERDREERVKEREAAQKLELDKFRIMMD